MPWKNVTDTCSLPSERRASKVKPGVLIDNKSKILHFHCRYDVKFGTWKRAFLLWHTSTKMSSHHNLHLQPMEIGNANNSAGLPKYENLSILIVASKQCNYFYYLYSSWSLCDTVGGTSIGSGSISTFAILHRIIGYVWKWSVAWQGKHSCVLKTSGQVSWKHVGIPPVPPVTIWCIWK